MKISQLVIVFSRLRCRTETQIILLVILEQNLIKMDSPIVRLQRLLKEQMDFLWLWSVHWQRSKIFKHTFQNRGETHKVQAPPLVTLAPSYFLLITPVPLSASLLVQTIWFLALLSKTIRTNFVQINFQGIGTDRTIDGMFFAWKQTNVSMDWVGLVYKRQTDNISDWTATIVSYSWVP